MRDEFIAGTCCNELVEYVRDPFRPEIEGQHKTYDSEFVKTRLESTDDPDAIGLTTVSCYRTALPLLLTLLLALYLLSPFLLSLPSFPPPRDSYKSLFEHHELSETNCSRGHFETYRHYHLLARSGRYS